MSGQRSTGGPYNGSTWWLGDDRKWRKGPPPSGWRQGTDGRWQPPGPDPAAVAAAQDPTERITIEPPPLPRPRRLPQWSRIAVGATATTTALVAALVLTIRTNDRADGDADAASPRDGGSDPTSAAPGEATTTTEDDVTDGRPTPASEPSDDDDDPTTSSTSTTGQPTTSTTETPPPSSSDPLALCSRGQRQLIERAEHPPEWYVERFDPDHNGIFCE